MQNIRSAVSYHTCVGAMASIARGYDDGTGSLVGAPTMTKEEWKILTGNVPWIGNQRAQITRCLDDLTQGALEQAGLPRITISAEHFAAVIAFFVHPTNFQVASQWLERNETLLTHSDIAQGRTDADCLRVTGSQLFTLVHLCYGDEKREVFQQRWEKRTRQGIDKSRPELQEEK